MPRYFIELSYNGSAYHGWQFQPREISVQQTIQEALSLIFKEKISLIGCGRTDSGVHANQYFAHFNTEKILEEDASYKLNALLPNDIAIKRYFMVDKLHARFDARDRTYKYFVHYRKNPFLVDNSYFLKQYRPDFKLMNETAQFLIGDHDFSTFEKRGSDNETSNCKIGRASCRERV